MATISLIDPYSQQAEEIARRKRMAQALQESGSQVLDMPTMPGVAISPYAGLAKVLESGLGAYQEAKAQKDYTALQDKYRTNYNTQLGEMARLISAPEIKGVAGQQAIEPQASVQEPIYATKPENLTAYGSGMGTQQDKDKILGWETTVPRIAGQPAIAPVEARPAGYISAADLQKIDIPEVKQLLMAKYLKQFEPERVTLGENQRILERTGGGGFKELVGPATAATTATLSPLGKLQSERAAIFAKNPNDPSLKIYDDAIANEVKNVAAERLAWDQKVQAAKDKEPNYTYKEEVDPTTGVKSLIKIDNKGVASEVLNSAGTKVKTEIPKTTPVYSEIVRDNKIYKIDLNVPEDKQKAIFIKDVTPDLEKVEVTTKDNLPAFRFFPRNELVALGEIPMQAKGIFLDLAQAGQLPLNWREIPEISSFVRQYLINQAGGITPKFLADLDVRVKEATARLGDQGIKFSATVPRADNYLTLGGAQPASAAAPATSETKAAPLPLPPKGKEKNYFKAGNYYQTDKGVLLFNGSKFVE
jgi:hypothetical protein